MKIWSNMKTKMALAQFLFTVRYSHVVVAATDMVEAIEYLCCIASCSRLKTHENRSRMDAIARYSTTVYSRVN